MLGRIVKRDRPIEMRSALHEVSCVQQGRAHEAMPDHERNGSPLLLGERQELRRKLAHIASPLNAIRFAAQKP